MVRMDKLLDAWRADPGVEPTVELCAMLTRASQKPGAREAIPSAFIVAFGTEALLKHPKAPDVHISVAMLYESCGESRQAARLLELAMKSIPDDPRVVELRKVLKVQRQTRELVSDMGATPQPRTPSRPAPATPPPSAPPPAAPVRIDSSPASSRPGPPASSRPAPLKPATPHDAETFDAPTTPLEPPTVTEVRMPSRRPPPPVDDDRDDPPTRTGDVPVMLQRDSIIDATTTDSSQQETLNMPVMRPPTAAASPDPSSHPRRARTLLGGVSALVPAPSASAPSASGPAAPPSPASSKPGAPTSSKPEAQEPQRRTHKTTITGRASVDGMRQSVRPPPMAPPSDPDPNPKTQTRVAPLVPPKEARPVDPDPNPKTQTRVAPLIPPKEARPDPKPSTPALRPPPIASPPSDPGRDDPKTTTRVAPPPSSEGPRTGVTAVDPPTEDDGRVRDDPRTATRVAPPPAVSPRGQGGGPVMSATEKAGARQTLTRASNVAPTPAAAPKPVAAPKVDPRVEPAPRAGMSPKPNATTSAADARKVAAKRGVGADDPLMKAALERRARWQSATPTPDDADGASLDSPTRIGDIDPRASAPPVAAVRSPVAVARPPLASSPAASAPTPDRVDEETDVDEVDDPPTRSMPLSTPPIPMARPSVTDEPKTAQSAMLPGPLPPPPALLRSLGPEPRAENGALGAPGAGNGALQRPSGTAGPPAAPRFPTEEISLGGAEVVAEAPPAPPPVVAAPAAAPLGQAASSTSAARPASAATPAGDPIWKRGGRADPPRAPAPAESERDEDEASTFSKALTNVWAQTGKMPPTPAEAERILREGGGPVVPVAAAPRGPMAEVTGDESVDTKLRPLAPLHPSARPPAPREDTGMSQSIVVEPSMIESIDDDSPSTYVMKPQEALAASRVDPRPAAPRTPPKVDTPNPVAEAMLAASAGLPAFQPPPSFGTPAPSYASQIPPPQPSGAIVQPGQMMSFGGALSRSAPPPPYASAPSGPSPYAAPPPDYSGSFPSMPMRPPQPTQDLQDASNPSGPYAMSGSFSGQLPMANPQSWPTNDPSYASGAFRDTSALPSDAVHAAYAAQLAMQQQQQQLQRQNGTLLQQGPPPNAELPMYAPNGEAPPDGGIAPARESRPVGLYLALGVAVVAVACLVGYAIYLLLNDTRRGDVQVPHEGGAMAGLVARSESAS